MAKLKIEAVVELRPVRVTVELPAELHSDLKTYAELMKRESGQEVADPARLIAPMLKRFMATDRGFRRFRRQVDKEKEG